jgi:hypothetical protein
MTATQYNPARIEKLWQYVTYPRIFKISDSLQTMKFILDEVLPRKSPESRDFNPDHLLTFTSPCILQPKKYLTAVIHVGIVEDDLQHQGRVLPVIVTFGFRNSHKGSWFVPVQPARK